MKRFLIFCIAGLLQTVNIVAQDIILMRNADEIKAVVTEITDTEVLYRPYGTSTTLQRSVSRDKVFSITYSNGEKEMLSTLGQPKGASGYPWPRVSRAYSVGDVFSEGNVRGLVVYTTDGGRHGLIMSLTQTKCVWGGAWTESREDTFEAFDCLCHDRADGWKNMQTISDIISHTKGLSWSNFPAFDWCRSLGDGWYLPACDEVKELSGYKQNAVAATNIEVWKAYKNLNADLAANGGRRMRMSVYWTSTESENTKKALTGVVLKDKPWEKNLILPVVAFHKF